MREPFRERQILIGIALEHLQKFQVGVARILHIMRQRLQHVAHISRLKIHGTSAASGGEHGHSSLSCNVVLPFVGVGMPVQFANPSRMHRHNRRRDRGGNFELAGIHNAHLAALAALRNRLLRSSKSKILRRRAQRTGSHFLILGQWSGNRRLENKFLPPHHLFHRLFTHAEIFGEHIVGRVRHPVAEQHGFVFRKVAVVEHQQKLAAIWIQPLNGMRNARGKVPEIAFRHVADKAFAVGIESRNARVAVEHKGPLRSGVPVQLADAACGQPHVDAGNRFRNRELPHRDLARPSALLHALVRDSEGIFESLHAARIRLRRQERVRILRIDRSIARTGRAGTLITLGRVRRLGILFRFLARGIRGR